MTQEEANARRAAAHFKHGEAPSRNGKQASAEYRAWRAMIDRCIGRNPADFKNYTARGIRVCKRWRHNYLVFLKDMGRKPSEKLTLERINNDKGYSPANCRWATTLEQSKNHRPRTPRTHCHRGHPAKPFVRCIHCWRIWNYLRKEKS